MEITLNGKKTELDGPLTVSELLVQANVKMPDMVSVEINGEILEREQFAARRGNPGDSVEFLYFMGGGA